MSEDIKYMYRCLQLAAKGRGNVSPNPMVGAVIVHKGFIIGEGYHRCFGQAHAEVNAIESVKDKNLLAESVLYVSLEPCSHYGKTPPCAELIIKCKIPKVVVACLDPFSEVSGRGIKMLREAGVEVILGILEQESLELNKEFICLQMTGRPYVYLKWAQSRDHFIARKDSNGNLQPVQLSNPFTSTLVHKMRSETDAIMIGTNTVLVDNPRLTTRLWRGKNPIRIILDRENKIPEKYNIFDDSAETLVFTEQVNTEQKQGKTSFIPIKFDDNLLYNILDILGKRKINSLMVEGGSGLLQSFINNRLWNEALIETSDCLLDMGHESPSIQGTIMNEQICGGAIRTCLKPSSLR